MVLETIFNVLHVSAYTAQLYIWSHSGYMVHTNLSVWQLIVQIDFGSRFNTQFNVLIAHLSNSHPTKTSMAEHETTLILSYMGTVYLTCTTGKCTRWHREFWCKENKQLMHILMSCCQRPANMSGYKKSTFIGSNNNNRQVTQLIAKWTTWYIHCGTSYGAAEGGGAFFYLFFL